MAMSNYEGVWETKAFRNYFTRLLKLKFKIDGRLNVLLSSTCSEVPCSQAGLTCAINILDTCIPWVDNALRKERWHPHVVFTFPQAVDLDIQRPLSVTGSLSDRVAKLFVAAPVLPANRKATFSAIDVCYKEIWLDFGTCST